MGQLINLEDLNEFKNQMFNAIFPVGSIYTTVNSAETASTIHDKFGGTWEALNSGNAVKIPVDSSIVVKTSSSPVLNTRGKQPLMFGRNDNGVTYKSGGLYVNAYGSLVDGSGSAGSNTGLLPANLYADMTGALQVYMFKRTA